MLVSGARPYMHKGARMPSQAQHAWVESRYTTPTHVCEAALRFFFFSDYRDAGLPSFLHV